MIVYTAENSSYFLLFVAVLSMFAGIATSIIELEKDKKLGYNVYTGAVVFKGAFIGAFAPILMFLILLTVEPMAMEKFKLNLNVNTSTLRFIYLGLCLMFSRVLVIETYRFIEKKGKNNE